MRLAGQEWKAIQEYIYSKEGGVCQYCGKSLGKTYTIDHIIPLCHGGTHDESNLRLSCYPCNKFKGSRNIPQFRKRILATLTNPWLIRYMDNEERRLIYNISRRYMSYVPNVIFFYERSCDYGK